MKRYAAAVTIVLTTLGIIVPIVWSITQNRTSVAINLLSATTLVQPSEEVFYNELTVTYAGTEINNLAKYQFNLVNTGSRPIDDSAVKEFPKIMIPENVQVLRALISHTIPSGVQASLKQFESPRALSIGFDLLNQSDAIFVTLYTDGELSHNIEVAGRIIGVRKIYFENLSGPTLDRKIISGWKRFQAIVTPIGGILITAVTILTLIFYSLPRIKRRKSLQENPEQLISLRTKEDLVRFADDFLDFLPKFVRRNLIQRINTTDFSNSDNVNSIHFQIRRHCTRFDFLDRPLDISFLIGGILGSVGATIVAFMTLFMR